MLISLPIYHFAAILAPASIHKKIELIIRGFLWKGGKVDSKKFSLVKWDQVTLPYEKGGMSIRLPAHPDLALRETNVWRFITGKDCWWKKVLEAKYMNHARSLLLEEHFPIMPCTQVWNLVKKYLPLIKENSSKLLGNRKCIKIWEDGIMGNPPLANQINIQNLRGWMSTNGIFNLNDISLWKNGNWAEWRTPNLPRNLKSQSNSVINLLKRVSPLSLDSQDSFIWDPNGGEYSVKSGYLTIQAQKDKQYYVHWRTVWKAEILPKVKIFIRTLLKGKVLTVDNLKKNGFAFLPDFQCA